MPLERFPNNSTVNKKGSGLVKVLGWVVAVLACVAAEMWHFFSGNELKNDRFRPSKLLGQIVKSLTL